MPMNPELSAAILNALGKTGGSAGKTPAQEAEQLLNDGVNVNGDYGPVAYVLAYIADDYELNGPTAKELDKKRGLVNATSWYYTTNVTEKRPDPKPGAGDKDTITVTGWTINQREQQRNYWPEKAYLALYTTMPDKDGKNFVEPAAGTSYLRVDLHNSVISGGVSISEADEAEENYKSITKSIETIMTNEVVETPWGTIVGFGVHEKKTPGPDAPKMWARLKSDMPTALGKVPLFARDKLAITFGPMGETEGCTILDGLMGFKSGSQISFTGACWLGLLTRPPKTDRTAYEDGAYFSEPNDPAYHRARIDVKSRIDEEYTLGGAEPGEPVTINSFGDKGQPMVVKNQSLIPMDWLPESATTVVAWGLWHSSDTTSKTKPFLVGTIKDSSGNDSIEFAPGEIPIVRVGGLRISMM